MVVIRLKRTGVRNNPRYRVSVSDSRRARSIELLGHYNPMDKKLIINQKRYEHWIQKGAQPTLTVANLYKKNK